MNSQKSPVILLVEDDPDDQEITRRALKKGDVESTLYVVEDGEEAMEYLRHEGRYADAASAPEPDLILLDLNMPRKDGREVLQDIRSDDSLAHIPVVVLTTTQQQDEINRMYKLGCNSFITKPNELSKFAEVIRQLEHYWFVVVLLPDEA